MNRGCKGAILLVGEGDFSLTVALSRQLPEAFITTSSLLSEDDIRVHKQATANIQLLQDQGIGVLFNVDATKLHEHDSLHRKKFSRIIFNFPHTGGKSNIKKNRQLLKDYFQSSVQLLEENGQICVTLCQGQGGTPADKPQREWSDSWQVVSMATYSNLILNEVVTFNAEDFKEYSSTGFRSQDKHFNTEGALTHIFIKVKDASLCIPHEHHRVVKIGQRSYSCPSYLAEKMNRNLLYTSGHPLSAVRQYIQSAVSRLYSPTVTPDMTDFPIVCQSDMAHTCKDSVFCLKPLDEAVETTETDNKDESYLRPTLLEHASDIKLRGVTMLFGEVFCKESIVSDLIPVKHQMLCVYSATIKNGIGEDWFGPPIFQTILDALRDLMPSEKYWVRETDLRGGSFELFENLCDVHSIHSYKHHGHCNESAFNELGVWGQLTHIRNKPDSKTYAVILNLDYVAKETFGIPDVRILWTNNECFMKKSFTIETIDCDAIEDDNSTTCSCVDDISDQGRVKTKSFVPFSLYPPVWEHHISFWENIEEDFDEQQFYDIIRNIARDNIKHVEQKERYQCAESGKWSRCYIQQFQSCDQALSYDVSHDMQKAIRLEVAKQLQVQLR